MVEKVEKILEETSMKADQLKRQTADALEEAAKKLREAGLSPKAEDVKRIISDVQERVSRLGEEVGAEIQKVESEYHARAEPVEKIIATHPIPAVLVAAGLGFLLGALIFRCRD